MRQFTALFLLVTFSFLNSHAAEGTRYVEEAEAWNEDAAYPQAVNFEANLGILMTPVGFGSQITLYQHLTSFFQVGQSFQYYRNDDGLLEDHDLHYGIDLRMRIAPFQEFLFAPHASVSVGYNRWQNQTGMIESPRVSYDLGFNIQLTQFFSLLLVHQDISFLNETPTTFWGNEVQSKTFKSNDVMLTFRLDNSMF